MKRGPNSPGIIGRCARSSQVLRSNAHVPICGSGSGICRKAATPPIC